MRKLLIRNAIIENIIVAASDYTNPDYDEVVGWVDGADIGYGWVNGSVVAPTPPAPTQEEIDNKAKEDADRAVKDSVKADSFVKTFVNMTPAEVEAYIDTNVTDLNSAKSVVHKLSLMMLWLARREFKE